ncbi:MAG: hypothetical protein JJU42_16455 [Rhodobacteraceae bacterium]|nr:hypothetical protein [Paracoccaceae bacterium]
MSLFSRLFGGGGKAEAPAPSAPPEIYKDFEIFVEPRSEGGQYRVCARIEKEVGGTRRTQTIVRADTTASLDDARAMSLAKARKVIDEQGERLFG